MKSVMYHYVRHEDKSQPGLKFLHIEDFKKQLDYFSENYTILHPDVLKQSIISGKKTDGVILTFDDGLKDHYDFVFPELQKRGLSAIFYITTGVYERKKVLDVHRLHLLLGRFEPVNIYHRIRSLVTENMLPDAHIAEFERIPYSLQDENSYTVLVKKMMNYFISYQYKEQILDTLMNEFFGGDHTLFDSFYLHEQEIKRMYNEGMIFGSHTKNHPVMSKLSVSEQQQEIQDSFDYLEKLCIKLPYKTFCYPYGGFHSFTGVTENILRDCGTAFSFNVEPRDISDDDLTGRPQALPRYDCNNFQYGQVWK